MRAIWRILGVFILLVVACVGIFHIRIERDFNRPLPAATSKNTNASGNNYYFAYGSNMSTRYIYNVRNVLPTHSEAGLIENYEVRMLSPGLNALEPAFAYLLKAESKIAHGVVHQVTDADLIKIKESEAGEYEWATLPVRIKSGEFIQAQTLVRRSGGEKGEPSRRYLNILIEGATEHGLPNSFIAELKTMPSVYVPVASEVVGDIVIAVVMKRSGKCSSVLIC